MGNRRVDANPRPRQHGRVVGYRLQDPAALLACVFELEAATPDEPWVHTAITRGLRSHDPDTRELAVATAATVGGVAWLRRLVAHAIAEPQPWLARFTRLVVRDLQAQY